MYRTVVPLFVGAEDEDPLGLELCRRRRLGDIRERVIYVRISQSLVSSSKLDPGARLIDRAKVRKWLGRCPTTIGGCGDARNYRVGVV